MNTRIRTVYPLVVVVWIFCSGFLRGDELTEGNFLVANGAKVTEYTRTGSLVQQIDVPNPVQGVTVTCRDLVVESTTRFHLTTRNDFATYLSTYDTDTNSWTHRTVEGWSMSGVTYYGSIGMSPRYIYATDIGTGGQETYGIIRFDIADLDNPKRFYEDNPGDPRWHEAKFGRDGFVYALSRGPGFNLAKIDPETMETVDSFQIYDSSIMGVSVAQNGHIYALTLNSDLIHYDETGKEVERIEDVGGTDVELSGDGVFLVGSGGNKVTLVSENEFEKIIEIDTSEHDRGGAFDHNFVAWIEDPCSQPTHSGTNRDDSMFIDATGLNCIKVFTHGGDDNVTVYGDGSQLKTLEINCGDGNDTVTIKVEFSATVILGKGNDNFSSTRKGGHLVYGGEGNDFLSGSNGADILIGGDGQDRIDGKNGDDWLDGGAAIDTINGGNGNDIILGGGGNDILNGNGGADIVDGGGGHDLCQGNNGSDVLMGRAGNDTLRGHAGVDFLFGGFGQDILDGGGSNSFLAGGNSDDTLRARGGPSNAFLGGQGRDTLYWSTDLDAASRYVEDSRDSLIPRDVWNERGIKISLSRFVQLIQSALNRVDAAGLPAPQF